MILSAPIQITPEILGLVAGIDEFKGTWRTLGTLPPDRLNALLRVATIESIGSSTRIEGSRLSDRDVERLLSNLQIQRFDNRDEQEVAGCAKVMEMVFTSWQDIALTDNHVKQLHRDRLVFSDKDEWHRGHYKTSPNSVVAFDVVRRGTAYYLSLRQTQGTIRTDTPDRQPWLLFFLRALAEQVRRLARKLEREKLVLAALPELSLRSSSSRANTGA
jgi:hypothetical protein